MEIESVEYDPSNPIQDAHRSWYDLNVPLTFRRCLTLVWDNSFQLSRRRKRLVKLKTICDCVHVMHIFIFHLPSFTIKYGEKTTHRVTIERLWHNEIRTVRKDAFEWNRCKLIIISLNESLALDGWLFFSSTKSKIGWTSSNWFLEKILIRKRGMTEHRNFHSLRNFNIFKQVMMKSRELLYFLMWNYERLQWP